jgi:hypothetical protein
MTVALLFSVAGMVSALVLAESLARAIPAWRETRAALSGCPPYREALVHVEYRFERAPLPRGRRTSPRPARATRRMLRDSQLNAAA